MIDRPLDLQAPAYVVIYTRMSTKGQNPRSPEQQKEMIEREMRNLKCNFIVVGHFSDPGITGRKIRRRPGLMAMVQFLLQPNNRATLVLVDEISRLGRNDDIQTIKMMLRNAQGIRVLSAQAHFADPFQLSGQVLDSMGQIIAAQENRTKARQVVRGKIDAILQGHWPGGPIPFGFQLQPFYKVVHGRQEHDYSILIPNPDKRPTVVLAFERAAETGWGEGNLAKALKKDPRIPEEYKRKITPAALRVWLRNPLYRGDYVWNKQSTDYQNDRRIAANNKPEDWTVVEGFCEPLVSRELWFNVEKLRLSREEIHNSKNGVKNPEEQQETTGIGRGFALKYLLSGLVVCAVCQRAMQITSCGGYRLKNGELRRYEKYYCPATRQGRCTNKTTIPEEWLRREVVSRLMRQLFPVTQPSIEE